MKLLVLRSFRLVLVLLVFTMTSFAQSGLLVNGKVNATNGEPLVGVTVAVKGNNTKTVTKADGTFQINVQSANAVLVFSYVGYTTQQLSVNGQSQIAVSLTPHENALQDVVVVGYGTQKKKNVTGSVATFNAEKLDERPILRVDQALVGQLAGVHVKQNSGVPGQAFSIQVRGIGSIGAGNEPLYVIDGFPISDAVPYTTNRYGASRQSFGNPLDNINPNDIESIEVLKDAAAAAIYGSRAANGVVLITTKKGQSGKPKINVNTFIGYNERSRKLDMLSAEEWIDRATEMINASWVASGTGRTASQTTEERRQILGLDPGAVNPSYMVDDRWFQPGHPGLRFVDWQDATFRKGMMQNYQVSASGASEFVKYYVSGNYVKQEGMVFGMDYTGYSARANVEINANKRLKFGINLAPTYSITNDPGVESKDNALHLIAGMAPVVEDTMGLYINSFNNGDYIWGAGRTSPYARLQNQIGQSKTFRTVTSVFGEYQIIKGLAFKTTFNLDNADNDVKDYVPYTTNDDADLYSRQAQLTALSYAGFNHFKNQTFVNENTLSYNKVVAGIHDISLLAGTSYNTTKQDYAIMSSSGGLSSSVITTLNAAATVGGYTAESKNVLLSYFGRVQYSLMDKYLMSASIRRDGSSRFGANTRWGMFPSASVGWRISEEPFIKGNALISDLKLRGSWGKSGNYAIPDYGSLPLLGTYNYTFGDAQAFGQAPAGIPNPDLSWEKSETIDGGLDIGIFKNRFTASFDYYNKMNTALLLRVPIPQATGFSTSLSNIGKVRNTGWEVELTSRNLTGLLQWTTSVNFSHNTNKVLALAEGQTQIFVPSQYDISNTVIKVGYPINSINVVRQIGILTQDDINKGAPLYGTETAGDPKYDDANGDGKIDANDRVIVGHPNPDYTWGVTNTLRFKGFDLSVLVQGQWGGSIYSLWGRALNRTGASYNGNALGYVRDRWRSPENPGAGKVGKAYSNFGRIKNTDWLYPSDYWRVRDITLGYNLGQLFKAKAVQAARIYVTAENFFGKDKYLGGFNPEAANTRLSSSGNYPEVGDYGGLPLPKSLIVGLNFTF
jgi:TonB-dependent starch-binding outer membrane protein SusC